MPRITLVEPADASGKAKQLLDAVQAKLGLTPNLMKTLATSPPRSRAISGSMAPPRRRRARRDQFREQIALAVAAGQFLRSTAWPRTRRSAALPDCSPRRSREPRAQRRGSPDETPA